MKEHTIKSSSTSCGDDVDISSADDLDDGDEVEEEDRQSAEAFPTRALCMDDLPVLDWSDSDVDSEDSEDSEDAAEAESEDEADADSEYSEGEAADEERLQHWLDSAVHHDDVSVWMASQPQR